MTGEIAVTVEGGSSYRAKWAKGDYAFNAQRGYVFLEVFSNIPLDGACLEKLQLAQAACAALSEQMEARRYG